MKQTKNRMMNTVNAQVERKNQIHVVQYTVHVLRLFYNNTCNNDKTLPSPQKMIIKERVEFEFGVLFAE